MPRVYVIDRADRKALSLKHVDASGRATYRSARTRDRRDAERAAARWEDEITASGSASNGGTAWNAFVDLYLDRHLSGLSDRSRSTALSSLAVFESVARPATLSAVTSETLSYFVGEMRGRGRAASTIRTRLADVRASLNWAVAAGMLPRCPTMPRLPRQSGSRMRGRPLTDSEYAALLAAVPKTVGESRAASWDRLLRMLWASGLRLGEALSLDWQDDLQIRPIALDSDQPTLDIPADQQKSRVAQRIPIVPEFAAVLRETPLDQRSGTILAPARARVREGLSHLQQIDYASKVISSIGKRAGIITNSKDGKYASAHDLRRTFGARWSRKVLPQVLQLLMRHESIETTMRHYVGLDVQAAGDAVWAPQALVPELVTGEQNDRSDKSHKSR